ncbi:glyoxalase [bacterium]|nr:MAG: glyoxalase [bacterium]
MVIQDFYPIIVTDKLLQCRDFYVSWFGLEVGFESSWFIWLRKEGVSLAFMHPEHPSTPPGPESFSGKGMCLEFQVEDANAEYKRFIEAGLPVTYHLKDEPFGQRRFGLHDPAGVWIDIVEQIDPDAGWWDKYMI